MNWRSDGMKKILYVVGAGVFVGAVAATFYFLNSKKKKPSEKAYEYKSFNDKVEEDEYLTDVTIAQDKPMYENVKSSAIGSMYSRHEGAATIMSDSVDAIRENIKVSERTNDEIDDISAELNGMISED